MIDWSMINHTEPYLSGLNVEPLTMSKYRETFGDTVWAEQEGLLFIDPDFLNQNQTADPDGFGGDRTDVTD